MFTNIRSAVISIFALHIMSASGFCSHTRTTRGTQADLAFYQDDASLDAFIQEIEEKTARYTSDEFINHVLTTEQRQIDRQQEFNNTLLYEVSLPFSRNGVPLQLGIYNKDIIKATFTAAHVGLDWYLYRTLETQCVNALTDFFVQQQSLPAQPESFIATITNRLRFSYSTFKQPALAKLIGMHFVGSQLALALRNGLLGNDTTFSLFKKSEPLQNPIPIFSLVEEHIIMFLPFNSAQTNLIEIANSLFKRCGLIPAFFQSATFEMTKALAFQLLFIAWFNNMVLVPVWTQYVQKNYQNINKLFAAYQQLPATAKEQRAIIETTIATFVRTGLHFSFRTWFALRNKKIAEWNLYSSIITSLPGWYTLIKGAYNIYQQATQDVDQEIGNPAPALT
ncbi:hypothetical protein K2X40_02315 [Candidatus Babeliales bacterium]|nr:hypothetical protein [Candidatus Babeliales bacterium]